MDEARDVAAHRQALRTEAPHLYQRVREDVSSVVDYLAQEGRSTAGNQLWNAVDSWLQPKPRTIVLAGLPGTGKSSLVNVLLREKGASPVGAIGGTASILVYRYAESAEVTVYPFEGDPVAAGLADISSLALGDTAVSARAIEVSLPTDSLLPDISVVDTPPISAAGSIKSQITYDLVRQSDAVILVGDASAPISASERRLLTDVALGSSDWLLVINKKDAYRGWREILRANQALLQEEADSNGGRILAISAAAANEVMPLDLDDNSADSLWSYSGIASVDAWLTGQVARVYTDGARMLLTECASLLSEATSSLEGAAAAMISQTPEAQRERLEHQLHALHAMSDTRRDIVDGELSKLDDTVQQEVRRVARKLQDHFATRSAKDSNAVLQSLNESLDQAVYSTMLHLNAFIESEVAAAVVRVEERLQLGLGKATLGDIHVVGRPTVRNHGSTPSEAPLLTALQTMNMASISGAGIRSLLMLAGAGPALGIGVGVLAGGAAALSRRKATELNQRRQAIQSAVAEQAKWVETEVPAAMRVALQDVRRDLNLAVAHAIRLREEQTRDMLSRLPATTPNPEAQETIRRNLEGRQQEGVRLLQVVNSLMRQCDEFSSLG